MSNKPSGIDPLDRTPKVSTDLRVIRTRKWLIEALLHLMKLKPFREIQVTEITDVAQVSRPTFYLHFHSKEELLLSQVDTAFAAFYTELSTTLAAEAFEKKRACIMIFEYWWQHAEIIRVITQAGIQDEILTRVRSTLLRVMHYLKAQTGLPAVDDQTVGLIVDFVAGGVHTLLLQWVAQGMEQSAARMGDLLDQLTAPIEQIVAFSEGRATNTAS